MDHCYKCESTKIQYGGSEEQVEFSGILFKYRLTTQRCEDCGYTVYPGIQLEASEILLAEQIIESGLRTGETFRFLRKTIGLGIKDISDITKVDGDTIRSWEDRTISKEDKKLFDSAFDKLVEQFPEFYRS